MQKDAEEAEDWDGVAYHDPVAMAWRCAQCDAVMRGDGDCPRCDKTPEPNDGYWPGPLGALPGKAEQ